MKMYTNSGQTAKLIELGFEKPKTKLPFEVANDELGYTYSIGELIEMLPEYSSIYDLTNMHTMKICWYVGHISTSNVSADELIDALYDMILKLKEEKII